jgi:hypothetical protein
MPRVGETPTQGDLNNILEVELNFIGWIVVKILPIKFSSKIKSGSRSENRRGFHTG